MKQLMMDFQYNTADLKLDCLLSLCLIIYSKT